MSDFLSRLKYRLLGTIFQNIIYLRMYYAKYVYHKMILLEFPTLTLYQTTTINPLTPKTD